MPPETSTDNPTAADPIADERARVCGIIEACGGAFPAIQEQALNAGWTLEATHAALFRAARGAGGRDRAALDELRAGRAAPGGNGTGTGTGMVVTAPPGDRIAAAALLAAGRGDVAAKEFGEHVVARLPRPSGWPELCAFALRAEGLPVPDDRHACIKAAFSTTSLPTSIATGTQKVMLQVFIERSSNWRPIARRVSADSFRGGKAIRLSAASKFEKVGQDGELKHGDLAEDAYDFKVETFGRLFGLTRQTIVNDDMGILNDLPTVLGAEAARSVSDNVFTTLLANAGSFFAGGNNNYLSGGSSPLSVTSLTAAIGKLRSQTDRDGRILDFAPAVLLVPSALEATARQVLNSVTLFRDQSVDQQPSGNPVAQLNIELVVEPRLDSSAYTGYSTTAWYVFSNPMDGALLVAFLRGREGPVVEDMQQEAEYLGMLWRAYGDWGSSLGEYRAAVKSAGA